MRARLRVGLDPPPARARRRAHREEERLSLEVLWDETPAGVLPAARGGAPQPHAARSTRGRSSRSRSSCGCTTSRSPRPRRPVLARMRAEHDEAIEAVRRSRARHRRAAAAAPAPAASSRRSSGPACATCSRRGARSSPTSRASARPQALAALEADDAFPAVVVCPASLRLNWEREAGALAAAPHDDAASSGARRACRRRADITILNYDIVAAPPRAPRARRPARARARRVALLQEPAGQAHPGGPRGSRSASPRDALGWR